MVLEFKHRHSLDSNKLQSPKIFEDNLDKLSATLMRRVIELKKRFMVRYLSKVSIVDIGTHTLIKFDCEKGFSINDELGPPVGHYCSKEEFEALVDVLRKKRLKLYDMTVPLIHWKLAKDIGDYFSIHIDSHRRIDGCVLEAEAVMDHLSASQNSEAASNVRMFLDGTIGEAVDFHRED